eukprot:3087967-Amphidinium_carterae.1
MLRCADCSRVLNSLWHGCKSEGGVASAEMGGRSGSEPAVCHVVAVPDVLREFLARVLLL